LLLFASLTLFSGAPVWNGIYKFLLTFFGWSAYIFVLGLLAFSSIRLWESINRTRILRWPLIIGLICICLLVLIESRLVMGALKAGVLAELLVGPLLGWSAAVQHVTVLGLLLVAIILTFRITFGHVLMVIHFIDGIIASSSNRLPARAQKVSGSSSAQSFTGQRPQYSRYSANKGGAAVAEPPGRPVAHKVERPRFAPGTGKRRSINEDETVLDNNFGNNDFGYDDNNDDVDLYNEETVAFENEPGAIDDDPLNDINRYSQQVSAVPRSPVEPQPLDLTAHAGAIRGARQQPLPLHQPEYEDDEYEDEEVVLGLSAQASASPPVSRQSAKSSASRSRPAALNVAVPAPAPPAVPPVELPNITSVWKVPGTTLLNSPEVVKLQMYGQDTASLAMLIQDTLRSFRVDAEVREEDISIGPTIIRFGIRPTGKPEMMLDEKTGKMVPVRDAAGQIVYETRTRVSRIMALQNDLALVLEAKTIRMEAPVPGRPYVGVEIPNKNSRMVTLREVLESKEYVAMKAKSKLAIGLGKDVAGLVRVGDLSKMPHLLIAGATGSGKSVMINTIIASILTQATPDDVRLLMVDPKMVELNMYNGIPHLLSPVVVEVEKVVSLLKNAISEMERRYRLFSQLGVRNLDGYRKMRLERIAQGDVSLNNLPSIVIIIDELADLMMAAPEEVEGMICRLAQLARATGIHLVVATQRPSVDVITGLIKANIPTRISFMVSSMVDSRTIIDMGGAERLLGRGDMLYLPADAGRPERIQGAFLSDEEAQKLAEYWQQQIVEHAQAVGEASVDGGTYEEPGWELKAASPDEFELEDDLLEKAEEVVREYGRASISLLQRRLRVGYSRAARLIDLLEENGVIGHSEASGRARPVYDQGQHDDYQQPEEEGQTLIDEADDIMDQERLRNEFLRNQAARLQERRQHAPPARADDINDEIE
jgi:DNA segregation ATPase FtsK/SpoIIIE-like protein